MDWYAVQYADDPAADNVFGREALKPRANPLLRCWLQSGGTLTSFIAAYGRGMEQGAPPSAHIRRDES